MCLLGLSKWRRSSNNDCRAGGALSGEGGKVEEEAKDSGEEGREEDGEANHEADVEVLLGFAGQWLVTSSS